jgi:hypothetical protein
MVRRTIEQKRAVSIITKESARILKTRNEISKFSSRGRRKIGQIPGVLGLDAEKTINLSEL